MPAALTHKSIMLLARERIRQIRDVLQSRLNAGRAMTDLERRLLFLATQAFAMMSGPPTPALEDSDPLRRRFGDINKFAVMGSMGPDITAFSAMLAPGQGWVFDLVHKGSPDGNQEFVVARTTDFAFELFNRAKDGLRADDQAGRLGDGGFPRALKAIQGYVLGHLCHIVGDVISHPYVNDIEWHQGTSSRRKFTHAGGEGTMDALVARNVLLRGSTREGQSWDVWWPTVDEVPPAFFRAYADALDAVYRAGTLPPANSFGEFLASFRDLAPPSVSSDFVRDGYHFYRNGIIGHGYGHGIWGWTGVLVWLAVPLVAAFPIAAALSGSGLLFGPGASSDLSWPQFFGVTIALSAPFFLGYGWWLLSLTSRGVEARLILGVISAIVHGILAVLFFVDLKTGAFPSWLRWLLFFVVPLVAGLAFAGFGIVDLAREGRGARGGATLVYSLPAVYLLLSLIFYGIFFALERNALGDATTRNVYLVVFTALLAVLLFLAVVLGLAKFVRDIKIPEAPAFTADVRHFVRLFDDASLFRDGAGQRFFPAAGRELLKLWWNGEGVLHLRSRTHQLEVSFDGTTVAQTVPAPVSPMTVGEYGRLLTATVKDSHGTTGHLQAAPAFPTDLDPLIPPGASFASSGEGFQTAGSTDAAAFILRHASKPEQAIRFSAFGPVQAEGETEEQILDREGHAGFRYVADGRDDVPEETIMDYAADVAAILCLGAAPKLTSDPVPPGVGPVAQIFRNWCLDRRRVNEWRMMVDGGAVSEKEGHPERPDPAMPRPIDPAWHPDPAVAGGERVANTLGWVPLLRQWIGAVAAGGDPLDETVHPNGFKNRELSQAMAFLFDLSLPARVTP